MDIGCLSEGICSAFSFDETKVSRTAQRKPRGAAPSSTARPEAAEDRRLRGCEEINARP
jgi:hypothetical protein